MIEENELFFFYSGVNHKNALQSRLLDDSTAMGKGLLSKYQDIMLIDLDSEVVEKQLDVLVVEDGKSGIEAVVNAAMIASKEIGGVSIGICPDLRALSVFMEVSTESPKVMTLDFLLTDRGATIDAVESTQDIYKKIASSATWDNTVVLGISNYAREDIAKSISKDIYMRGDSIFKKDPLHFQQVLPDIIYDALSKYTYRCMNTANKTGIAEWRSGKGSTPQKGKEIVEMIGRSRAFMALKSMLDNVAPTRAKVLLTGESGTGKEVCAKYLHDHSELSEGPFVAINCAAIPNKLLESELFGYAKGAFANAYKSKIGVVEKANGGTLFLDEIGDLELRLQAKILRLVQNHEYLPVGRVSYRKFAGRIIAATHQNLEAMRYEKTFREDLYFRLSVYPINVPSLKERQPDDIPLLVDHFKSKFSKEYQYDLEIEPDALDYLLNNNIPGNIRGLEQLIEYMFISCRNSHRAKIDLIYKKFRIQSHPIVNTAPKSQQKLKVVENESHLKRDCIEPYVKIFLDTSEKGLKSGLSKVAIIKNLQDEWATIGKKCGASAQLFSQKMKSIAAKALKAYPQLGKVYPHVHNYCKEKKYLPINDLEN
jgi:transcriptional regulator with GAF, ATPase, and Fis domain